MRCTSTRRRGALGALCAVAAVVGLPLLAMIDVAPPVAAVGPFGWNAGTGAPINVQSVTCIPSTNNCWAAGGSGGAGFIDYSTNGGSNWTAVPAGNLPAITGPVQAITCTTVSSANDCWAIAPVSGTLSFVSVLSFSPSAAWTSTGSPVALSTSSSVACVPASVSCFATDGAPGVVFTTNGTSWAAVSGSLPAGFVLPVGNAPTSFSCPTAAVCLLGGAVGTSATIASTTNGGNGWSALAPPFLAANSTVVSIACPTASVCFASGSAAPGSDSVIETGDGGSTWVPVTVPSTVVGSTIKGITCVSATTCAAVGPGNGASDDILAMNDGSTFFDQHTNESAYFNLVAVACTGALTCVAGGTGNGVNGIFLTTTEGTAAVPPASTLAVAYPGNGAATVAWLPPASGGPFTSATVNVVSGACTGCPASVTGPTSVAVVNGLTNATAYKFTVTVTNGFGTSAVSGQSAAVTPVAPAVTAPATWSTLLHSQQLNGVTCVSTTVCVAVGQTDPGAPGAAGLVETSSNGGSSWTAQSVPTGVSSLNGVGCATTTLCFAAGTSQNLLTGQSTGVLLTTNNGGTSWTASAVSTNIASLASVSCTSAVNCIVVGSNSNTAAVTMATPDSGSFWFTTALPAAALALGGVSCATSAGPPPSSLCSAVGSPYVSGPNQFPTILTSSNGGYSWTMVPSASEPQVLTPAKGLVAVGCPTVTACYAVGPGFSGGSATDAVVSTNGGVTWTAKVISASSTLALAGISCFETSGDNCWAVGQSGVIWSTSGGVNWIAQSSGTVAPLAGVSCASASICAAVGNVATGEPIGLSTVNGGTSWTVATPGITPGINALGCSGAALCIGVGSTWAAELSTNGGNSWTTSQLPVGVSSVQSASCASSSACFASGALGGNGIVLATTNGGTTWSSQSVPSGVTLVNSIACPSTSICVATGASGAAAALLATTNGGSSWSTSTVPSGVSTLDTVMCISTTSCMAGGAAAGGAAFITTTTSGATWTLAATVSAATNFSSVSCISATQCVATGSSPTGPVVEVTTSGTSFSAAVLPFTPPVAPYASALQSADCVSIGLCLVGGDVQVGTAFSGGAVDQGFVLNSANMFASGSGSNTWQVLGVPTTDVMVASLACPSSTSCLGSYGGVVQSLVSTVTVPGAPTIGTATLSGSTVTLTWTAPASNGGGTITGYTVTPFIGGTATTCTGCTGLTASGTATSTQITGLTSGTTYTFAVAATNSAGTGATSAQSNSVTIPPVTVPGAPTIGTATLSGSSVTLSWTAPASNGGGTITGYTVTPFIGGTATTCTGCTGLTASGTATSTQITGLTSGTTYTFAVAATNSAGTGATSAQSNSVTIPPVTITTTSLPNGTQGMSYSQALAATGGTLPYTWSVATGSLPGGLTLSGTGVISGKPNASGVFTFTVKVVDSASPANSTTQSLTITIPVASLAITTTSLPTAVITVPYTAIITAIGGLQPYSWNYVQNNLMTGFTFTASANQVTISGTPSTIGSNLFSITVTDSSSPPQTATATLPFNVVSNVLAATAVGLPNLPTGSAGVKYSQSLGLQGGTAPYTVKLTNGALPSGLTVSKTGDISGTPSIPLTATFTLSVTDSSSPKANTLTLSLRVIIKPAPSTQGYWEFATDGGVFTFGGQGSAWRPQFYGSAGGLPLAAPVVGGAATPDGLGYWEVASDGGVFTYGDAGFFGSMSGKTLSGHVVGIAPTPDGLGYWLVAVDGGIFSFGDASFFGSRGGYPFAPPMVAMASSPDGQGYWEVAANGAVFTFGDAGFFGSAGGEVLQAPVVGFSPTPDGLGYWLVSQDGGVFAYGGAKFFGSLGGRPLDSTVVAVASTLTGKGYWLTTADGRVFTFGDAEYVGSMGGVVLSAPIIAAVAP